MRQFFPLIFLLILLFSSTDDAIGQVEKDKNESIKQFTQGRNALIYGDTIAAFQYIQSAYKLFPTNEEIGYHYMVLLLTLDKQNATIKVLDWLINNNNRIFASRIQYELGRYYFKKQLSEEAIQSYQKVSIDDLNNDEIGVMKFEQAYLFFKKGEWDKAVHLLNNIRQVKKHQYYFDANYYAGFIALQRKELNLSMECFKIASSSNAYNKLTPFYISQLYYLMGDIDAAMTNCENALALGNQFYTADLEQLLGHLLFEKKEYIKALPYLENFVKTKTEVDYQDIYQLSFCYFESGQWNKAIDGFKKLASAEDSLGQNSMYLLATCYLKVNDLQGAKNAFLLCSTKSQNLSQKEVSAFNYAKLCVALKEYSKAVVSLDNFIISYPNSVYQAEAKSLWILALTYNNNFIQALEAYQSIERPSDEILKIYPNILFGRACLYLNEGQVDKAFELFETTSHLPHNAKVITQTKFWLGELGYKLGRIAEAIQYLNEYLEAPIELGNISKQHAYYTLGYCYLKTGEYQKAINHFNQTLIHSVPIHYVSYQQDAFTRVADCQMMLKNLKTSMQSFDKIIDWEWPNKDYATLQKSIILGGLGRSIEKIKSLESFIEMYPQSSLINDARIELADTYISQEEFQLAIAPLSQVLIDKKAIHFYPQAYYKLGIVYFNIDKNEMALNSFNDLISSFPNTAESEQSVEFVRNIYVEDQKPELFVQFMNEHNKPLTANEQDSLIFRSAMLKYEQKKYEESVLGLKKYIQQFPNGKNQLDAHYLLAEIAYTQELNDSAIVYFSTVAKQAPNKYAERAALIAARLYYFHYMQYEKAIEYFTILNNIATQHENKLESNRGLLRTQYKLEKWIEAAPIAEQIIQDKNSATDDLIMANMIIVHKNLINQDTSSAINLLSKVIQSVSSVYTAEAHYLMVDLLYKQGEWLKAEKTAFEMIKKQSSFEYWITKVYILLGDIYVQQKDNFNAIATYKSVSENASFEDLKKLASDKLKTIESSEQNNLK